MDLIKIGKFIAEKRKSNGLTQRQLAEQLGMSDKSVSKWERGICLPDVSVYLELCKILGITLNEFIAGEDIEKEKIIEKSEDNLIQVTTDGNVKRKKLVKIIALLLGMTIIAACMLGYVAYINGVDKSNYIEPVSKESSEMKMAEVLSGADGAFLYNYSVDDSYTQMKLVLSVYQQGQLVSDDVLGTLTLDQGSSHEGLIAIIPDFDNFQVKAIIANGGAKYTTAFDILEDVADREYYGRTASEINQSVNIKENRASGLLALIYGKNGISAVPIESIQNGELDQENDYMYYISYQFSKEND